MTRSIIASVVALVALATPAIAQKSGEADRLFREGRDLLEAGKLKEACEAFRESHRVAPSVGAMLNLGDCLARRELRAEAWESFRAAAALAREAGDRRELVALAHADVLAETLGFVIVVVPDRVAARKPAIALGDRRLRRSEWGQPLPVLPGKLRVSVSGDGARWRKTFETRAGETDPVPILVELPARDATGAPPDDGDDAPRSKREIAALVAGGAGLAAAAIGTGLALSARSRWNSVEACRATPPCSEEQAATGRSARTRANWATALLAGAAVLAGTGTYLWLTAPADGEPAMAGVAFAW